jgi:AcrR family transcriptional regulator
MAEIDEASEFAVGTLYTFFDSKEEILATLFETHIDKLLSGTESIRDNPDLTPREKIERSLEAVIRIALDNLDFYRIYWSHARGVEWGSRTRVGEYVDRAVNRYHACMKDVFRQAVEAGDIDPVFHPEFLAFFFRSLVRTSVRVTMLDVLGLKVEDSIAQAQRMLFEGIGPKKNDS